MSNRFVISDTHFGHKGAVLWVNDDGSPGRPFDDIDVHDQTMVNNWNAVVNPKDTVYHLGDVVINRRCLKILGLLNGRKVLVKGNHDIFKLKDYLPYFADIRSYVVNNDFGMFSHIPVHGECIDRFKFNIHGHLHNNQLKDPRFLNVCVEWTNYAPLAFDDLKLILNKREELVNEWRTSTQAPAFNF